MKKLLTRGCHLYKVHVSISFFISLLQSPVLPLDEYDFLSLRYYQIEELIHCHLHSINSFQAKEYWEEWIMNLIENMHRTGNSNNCIWYLFNNFNK